MNNQPATFDRLSAFLGQPVRFQDFLLYSPQLNEIAEIGEMQYYVHYLLSTFDKEKILLDLFGMDEQAFSTLSSADDYEVLTESPRIASLLSEGISFFTKQEVRYQPSQRSFYIGDSLFISCNNYTAFAQLIKQLNGAPELQEKRPAAFKNEKAKQLFQKLRKMRKAASEKNEALELKDISSILCSSEGNGIHIHNVGCLTVYQIYEQFERMSLKHKRDTILPVWANGYLKEGESLPDIMSKTNL
ncbi:hypothetical protein M6D81_15335 [Paenibacillus sp. J5C_2022]|uniref:hypothetical protein n=1 Tax=Paenibacillus sp. J5C2022 TaxID=2977129 RepID=UPI0021CFBD38|nr:hypothetical protein [Paenibacillus sp. J5C2022]MCU6710069.1 hypothetical protein [Paenibacillus sp. J5C2022]